MILQVLDQTTAPRASLRPEVHRKYVDVQFLAAGGPERIGWYEDLGDNEVDEELLETRDIIFYKNNPAAAEGVIEMRPGTYAVGCPHPRHRGGGRERAHPQDRHQGGSGHTVTFIMP